jgi:hypothetical protein
VAALLLIDSKSPLSNTYFILSNYFELETYRINNCSSSLYEPSAFFKESSPNLAILLTSIAPSFRDYAKVYISLSTSLNVLIFDPNFSINAL